MKKLIVGLLIAVTLSGCFPVFVPVHGAYGYGHGHHYYRDGYYNRY